MTRDTSVLEFYYFSSSFCSPLWGREPGISMCVRMTGGPTARFKYKMLNPLWQSFLRKAMLQDPSD